MRADHDDLRGAAPAAELELDILAGDPVGGERLHRGCASYATEDVSDVGRRGRELGRVGHVPLADPIDEDADVLAELTRELPLRRRERGKRPAVTPSRHGQRPVRRDSEQDPHDRDRRPEDHSCQDGRGDAHDVPIDPNAPGRVAIPGCRA